MSEPLFTADQINEVRRMLRALDKVLGDALDGKLDEKKKKTRTPRVSQLCPEDYEPTEEDKAKCKQFGIDWKAEAQAMYDWSIANAGRAVAKKADWNAAFRQWVRRRYLDSKAVKVESTVPVTRAGMDAERAEAEAKDIMEKLYSSIISGLEAKGFKAPVAIAIECAGFERKMCAKVPEGASRYVHRERFVKGLMNAG